LNYDSEKFEDSAHKFENHRKGKHEKEKGVLY